MNMQFILLKTNDILIILKLLDLMYLKHYFLRCQDYLLYLKLYYSTIT